MIYFHSFFLLSFLSYFQGYFTFPSKVYNGFSNSTIPFQLLPQDKLVTGDQYGHTVSIWEDLCLVSAIKRSVLNSNGNVDVDGVVYVFERDQYRQWKDTEIILASYSSDDGFGDSLSLYQYTAVIGAPKDDTLGTDAGYVYIYYTSTASSPFGSVQKISADKPEAGDYFGYSVAIIPGVGYYSHGAIVVGAYGHNRDGHNADSGSVFIFANSGNSWYQATVIQPSQSYASGYFGWSVSGYGNVIAVGAPGQESVYVYHMEGIEHECPHDGPPDQMPDACQNEDEHHHIRRNLRSLQGAGGGGGGAAPGQQNRPKTYSTWEYVEILHIQNDLQYYKGDQFGTSVSIINETSLMLAIGSPYDNDSGQEAGAVIIACLLPEDDIWSSWTPNGDVRRSVDNELNLKQRYLQGGGGGGGGGGAGGGGDPAKQDQREHAQNIWKIRSTQYTTDKDGSFWMLMAKRSGSNSNEMFGYRTALAENHLVVGTHIGNKGRGRVELLVFNETTHLNGQSPIYRGPLYQKEWIYETDLFDHHGGPGDFYGSAISINEDTILVGGYLTGYQGNFMIGTGGAYIFDAYTVEIPKDLSTKQSNTSVENTTTVFSVNTLISGILFVTCIILLYVKFFHESSSPTFKFINSNSNSNSDKDMDNTTSSVDTVDMNSRHPLKRSNKDNHTTSSSSSSSPSSSSLSIPLENTGKYSNIKTPSPFPSTNVVSSNINYNNNSNNVNVNNNSTSSPSSHQLNLVPPQSKKSKTSKYLQSNTAVSVYKNNYKVSPRDSDSDNDQPSSYSKPTQSSTSSTTSYNKSTR